MILAILIAYPTILFKTPKRILILKRYKVKIWISDKLYFIVVRYFDLNLSFKFRVEPNYCVSI